MKSIQLSLAVAAIASVVIAVGVAGTRNDATTGDPQSPPTSRSRTIPPTVSNPLVASPARLSLVADAGTALTTVVSVTHSGGGHLDVVPDSAVFGSPVVTPLGGGAFSVALRTSDVMPEGGYKGLLRIRLCATASCTSVIASTTVPYSVALSWANAGEWETYQGNPRHDGYVPIVVDVGRIQKRWEWQTPTPYYLNPVATAPGRVFVSERAIYSTAIGLHALDALDGRLVWRMPVEGLPRLNPPAAAGGVVYVTTALHQQTRLDALRVSDGSQVFRSSYDAEWNEALAPTIADGKVFINGGIGGGGIYAYNTDGGAAAWSRIHGNDEGTTPAVGDGYVYHNARREGLKVYDSATGNTFAAIPDPLAPSNTGNKVYDAAPMLGSPDHVFAPSGDAEQSGRRLVAYSPSTNGVRWISARRYCGAPAFKDGVVYALSCSNGTFDALEEDTGYVIWSWTPPQGHVSFLNDNVVVTRNVAFVSTSQALYAINLATHLPVWSVPTPGHVAISGDGTLYLVRAGKLLAYRLR